MKAVFSLEEFRKNLSKIVSRVMYGDQTVLVQKHSKPGVIVMSEQEYENLRDPRKRFSSQAEWGNFFRRLILSKLECLKKIMKNYNKILMKKSKQYGRKNAKMPTHNVCQKTSE